ncbi:MAG: hypothetical protein ILP17_06445 [Lachnospiraceae bacterium]|nr:hypothetical protein [Lachnospiraceae bacterium]MBP1585313.1 hypothetical protein [Lachnospiraceae bacterium]
MKILVVLFLTMQLVTGVKKYLQAAEIASEIASWGADSVDVPGDDVSVGDESLFAIEDVVGTWELYYCEMDGEPVDCDEDSAFYQTLTFSDDYTVVLTEYSYGERSFHISLPVEVCYQLFLVFESDDEDTLPESVARAQYTVLDPVEDADGVHMTVMLMFYSSDGYIESGYTMMFKKV